MANWTFEWILCILLTQQEGAKNLKVGDACAVWFFSIGRAERLVRFPDGGKCIALATRQRVLCRWVLCQCSSDGQTLHTGGRSQLLCCCELESGTGRQFVFFSLFPLSAQSRRSLFLGKNPPRVHFRYKRGLFLGTQSQSQSHFLRFGIRYTKQLETGHCSRTATGLMCVKSVHNEIAFAYPIECCSVRLPHYCLKVIIRKTLKEKMRIMILAFLLINFKPYVLKTASFGHILRHWNYIKLNEKVTKYLRR